MAAHGKYQRSRLHGSGPHHANFREVFRKDDDEISPIGNVPVIGPPNDAVPDHYKLELYRLRRRVTELECVVRDKNDRIVRAIKTLEHELSMWRQLLHDDVKETFDGVRKRTIGIEATLLRLKDKGSRFAPPLEMPAKWKKKS